MFSQLTNLASQFSLDKLELSLDKLSLDNLQQQEEGEKEYKGSDKNSNGKEFDEVIHHHDHQLQQQQEDEEAKTNSSTIDTQQYNTPKSSKSRSPRSKPSPSLSHSNSSQKLIVPLSTSAIESLSPNDLNRITTPSLYKSSSQQSEDQEELKNSLNFYKKEYENSLSEMNIMKQEIKAYHEKMQMEKYRYDDVNSKYLHLLNSSQNIDDNNSSPHNEEVEKLKQVVMLKDELISTLNQDLSREKEQTLQLQTSLADADSRQKDLQQKLTSLTDKTKEKIKKVLENQAKLEEQKSSLSQSLQEKESECVSLKLKMDAIDSNCNEYKTKWTEANEKCGQLSRDLQRKVDALNEHTLTIEMQLKELNDKDSAIKTLKQDMEQLKQSSIQLEKDFEERFKGLSMEEHEKMSRKLEEYNSSQASLQEQLKKASNENNTLKAEINSLKEKIIEAEKVSQHLEEYKSKAQKAIKQANQNATTLSNELAEMKQRNVDLENKYLSAEQRLDEMDKDLKAKESSLNSMNEQKDSIGLLANEYLFYALSLQIDNAEMKGLVEKLRNDLQTMHTNKTADFQSMPSSPSAERENKTYSDQVPSSFLYKSSGQSSIDDLVKVDVHPSDQSDEQVKDFVVVSESEQGGVNDSFAESPTELLLVQQLQRQINLLRKELANSHAAQLEIKRLMSTLQDENVKLKEKYDELFSFHERTKKLTTSSDSAANIEYLKKCVLRLMITKELSEKTSLYEVIATILKFTAQEKKTALATLNEESSIGSTVLFGNSWGNLNSIASTSYESIFGSTRQSTS